MPQVQLVKRRFFVFLLGWILAAAGIARADESYPFTDAFTRTAAFDSTGEIVLENINGSVEVRTWDKDEILIEGEKSARTAEELDRIDLKIELSAARAAIRVRLPKRSDIWFFKGNIRAAVRFKLTVPRQAVLAKIAVVNAAIVIDGARGSVDASSVNGSVRASGLAGPVHLETVNGAIKAQFDTVTAQQKLSFNTVNGQIIVSLPKDAGFQLRSSVVNGKVSCDFPIETGSGKQSRNLSGKIGDGRASLVAETVNGSIRIESQ